MSDMKSEMNRTGPVLEKMETMSEETVQSVTDIKGEMSDMKGDMEAGRAQVSRKCVTFLGSKK